MTVGWPQIVNRRISSRLLGAKTVGEKKVQAIEMQQRVSAGGAQRSTARWLLMEWDGKADGWTDMYGVCRSQLAVGDGSWSIVERVSL